jgi:hypothetical protein
MRNFKAGYSLFELVILIVILGIVCFFIFVNSDSLTGQRPEETEIISAELVRVGIHNYSIFSKQLNRTPVYPAHLDEAAAGTMASAKTPLFTVLFPEKGVQVAWKKLRENQYIYAPSTPEPVADNSIYFYDPLRGTFEKGKTVSTRAREASLAPARPLPAA